MLSHANVEKLGTLLAALKELPEARNASATCGIGETLSKLKVAPSLAFGAEVVLTSGGLSRETLESAVNFAIRRKLATYQYICLGFALIFLLLSVGMAAAALEHGGTYVLFWGAIGVGCVGAYRFSQAKKLYTGKEGDFQAVERIPLPVMRERATEDLY